MSYQNALNATQKKKKYLYASFTDTAMQASVTPSDFVDFVDAEARNMAGCRELPRFRAAELTPVTARVQYMRCTTLLHNIAQVGLLRKHRTPQGPIRKILSTLLGVSFILCFCQPTKQVQNSNIPSLQKVWVSHQHFQLSSADWLYLIRLASLRGLKNHLGEHLK